MTPLLVPRTLSTPTARSIVRVRETCAARGFFGTALGPPVTAHDSSVCISGTGKFAGIQCSGKDTASSIDSVHIISRGETVREKPRQRLVGDLSDEMRSHRLLRFLAGYVRAAMQRGEDGRRWGGSSRYGAGLGSEGKGGCRIAASKA